MGLLVSIGDFKGMRGITIPPTTSPNYAQMGQDIDAMEYRISVQLFGMTLYQDFQVNYNVNPLYAPIQAPLVYNGYYSNTVKDLMVTMIYLELSRSKYVIPTENGRVSKLSENAQVCNPYVRDLEMYNQGVEAWKSIQGYLADYFTDFQGKPKKIMFY